jgi:hypothetical protein
MTMSHKLYGKNLERAALKREIAELQALKTFFNETGEQDENAVLTAQCAEAEKELAIRERKIQSWCPLCDRIFYEGDALCSCGPAKDKEGNPRVIDSQGRHAMRRIKTIFMPRKVRKAMLAKQALTRMAEFKALEIECADEKEAALKRAKHAI